MSQTRVRKIRRQQQRVIADVTDQLLDTLTREDSNAALRLGYQLFGRENFDKSLKAYLAQNLVKVAFIKAAERCIRLYGLPKQGAGRGGE